MKKRFGISISKDNFYFLDEISKKNRITRSQLVERAIEDYIARLRHGPSPHMCRGFMIIVHEETEHEKIGELIEQNLVSFETHFHEEGRCIRILYIKGSTEDIERSLMRLSSLNVKTIYLPTH